MTHGKAWRGRPDAGSFRIEYSSFIEIAGRNEARCFLSYMATVIKRQTERYLVSTYSKSCTISFGKNQGRYGLAYVATTWQLF